MNKLMTESGFVNKASRGPVPIGKGIYYIATKVNSINFDLNSELECQLIKEGKYDQSYIGFVTREKAIPYSLNNLPIYGSLEGYNIEHFKPGLIMTILEDLKDKDMSLLERANSWLSKEN